MTINKNKWTKFTIEDTLPMREKIKYIIKEESMSWSKLSELSGLERSNLKITVERQATYLNRFMDLMGYEVVFKKK